MKLFYIALFGVIGVFARYLIGNSFKPTGVFPTSTLIINVVGSFLIGAVYALGVERDVLSPELRTGIMVGLLGGFTTFSAYSLDLLRLVEEAQYLLAGIYFFASTGLAVAGTALGLFLARAR